MVHIIAIWVNVDMNLAIHHSVATVAERADPASRWGVDGQRQRIGGRTPVQVYFKVCDLTPDIKLVPVGLALADGVGEPQYRHRVIYILQVDYPFCFYTS